MPCAWSGQVLADPSNEHASGCEVLKQKSLLHNNAQPVQPHWDSQRAFVVIHHHLSKMPKCVLAAMKSLHRTFVRHGSCRRSPQLRASAPNILTESSQDLKSSDKIWQVKKDKERLESFSRSTRTNQVKWEHPEAHGLPQIHSPGLCSTRFGGYPGKNVLPLQCGGSQVVLYESVWIIIHYESIYIGHIAPCNI